MENHIACLSRLLQNYSMFNGNNVLLFCLFLDIKKISFGKIEKINPIFEFGSSKTTYFKSMCVHLLF